jgi:hypothetical protein
MEIAQSTGAFNSSFTAFAGFGEKPWMPDAKPGKTG